MKKRKTPLSLIRLSIFLAPLMYASCQNPDRMTGPLNRPDLAQQTFDSVNRYRIQADLSPLLWHNVISELAEEHSMNMAAGLVPFGHEDFPKRVEELRARISIVSAGENVGYVSNRDNGVDIIVAGWMEKETHQNNILGHFHLSGIGAAQGSGGELFITQIFVQSPH